MQQVNHRLQQASKRCGWRSFVGVGLALGFCVREVAYLDHKHFFSKLRIKHSYASSGTTFAQVKCDKHKSGSLVSRGINKATSTLQKKSRLLVQEMVDHLPVLALASHRKGRDSSVVRRIDIRLVVYQKVHYFLVAILHCQVDCSIAVLK